MRVAGSRLGLACPLFQPTLLPKRLSHNLTPQNGQYLIPYIEYTIIPKAPIRRRCYAEIHTFGRQFRQFVENIALNYMVFHFNIPLIFSVPPLRSSMALE